MASRCMRDVEGSSVNLKHTRILFWAVELVLHTFLSALANCRVVVALPRMDFLIPDQFCRLQQVL
jgi:hypothetical protein